jgi:hypothetical protein
MCETWHFETWVKIIFPNLKTLTSSLQKYLNFFFLEGIEMGLASLLKTQTHGPNGSLIKT